MSSDPKLQALRAKIDRADLELLNTLSERMKIVEEIGEYKHESEQEIHDEKRESEVMSARIASGKNRGLSGELIRDIFESIFRHARELEK